MARAPDIASVVLDVECTLSGTHKGAFTGVGPTINRIELPTPFCVQIDGGKLTDCRAYFDTRTLLEQIGANFRTSDERRHGTVPEGVVAWNWRARESDEVSLSRAACLETDSGQLVRKPLIQSW
jgi:hypothetical protein